MSEVKPAREELGRQDEKKISAFPGEKGARQLFSTFLNRDRARPSHLGWIRLECTCWSALGYFGLPREVEVRPKAGVACGPSAVMNSSRHAGLPAIKVPLPH